MEGNPSEDARMRDPGLYAALEFASKLEMRLSKEDYRAWLKLLKRKGDGQLTAKQLYEQTEALLSNYDKELFLGFCEFFSSQFKVEQVAEALAKASISPREN